MAALPSSPHSPSGNESKLMLTADALRKNENNEFISGQIQNIQTAQKISPEKQPTDSNQRFLPGTYYLKANEARGRHMVQYVYANLTNPNDESVPFHIRERYKEIQKERLRGYHQVSSPRSISPTFQHGIANRPLPGNKVARPASASYERQNDCSEKGPRSSKCAIDSTKKTSSKLNQKTAMKNIQQTRSSNAVLSPKRENRSRSKTSSPRPRRPFSIAAESTSDTDPIENQRSMELLKHKSPPRVSANRQVRRQQYLATKFKLAVKNSKYTQTFVAAVASMEESSGSATTVISRQHSTTQTEMVENNVAKPTPNEPDCEATGQLEERDKSEENRNADREKPPIVPQNIARSEAALPTLTEKGQESLEWRRAKVRLRSTPRSPSPPLHESQYRVASADWVRLPSKERTSCLISGRRASGHNELASRVRSPTPPSSERKFTTSSTQIEEHQTIDTGVQVKLKKKRSQSQREARKEKRSPSPRSAASKISSQSGSQAREDGAKIMKKKKKKKKKPKKSKSRDPSLRSLRSLRSFQSDASAGILKHVKIDNFSSTPAVLRNERSASAAALGEKTTKKKKRVVKKKKSSNKIARFLRTLSKDKEAIKVISQMASLDKKRASK